MSSSRLELVCDNNKEDSICKAKSVNSTASAKGNNISGSGSLHARINRKYCEACSKYGGSIWSKILP